MGKIKGEDVVLINADTDIQFACARQITFNIDRELLETSITGTGMYRSYTPGAIAWSGDLEGIAMTMNDHTAGGLENLYEFIQNGNLIQLRWYETDVENAHWLKKEGNAYLNSISEISSFDNIVTFNASFTGSGPITITTGDV